MDLKKLLNILSNLVVSLFSINNIKNIILRRLFVIMIYFKSYMYTSTFFVIISLLTDVVVKKISPLTISPSLIFGLYNDGLMFFLYISLIPYAILITTTKKPFHNHVTLHSLISDYLSHYDLEKRYFINQIFNYMSIILLSSLFICVSFMSFDTNPNFIIQYIIFVYLFVTGSLLLKEYLLDLYDKNYIVINDYLTDGNIIDLKKSLDYLNVILGGIILDDVIYVISNKIHAHVKLNDDKYDNELDSMVSSLSEKDDEKLGSIMNIIMEKSDLSVDESIIPLRPPIKNRILKWMTNNWDKIIPQSAIGAGVIWLVKTYGPDLLNLLFT